MSKNTYLAIFRDRLLKKHLINIAETWQISLVSPRPSITRLSPAPPAGGPAQPPAMPAGRIFSAPMRWGGFFKTLTQIRTYLGEVWAWRAMDHFGLNPGSAWFALLLYILVPMVVYTGFVAEWVETWHGRLSYGCLFLIGAHLLGLAAHALRHREASPLAMVHGRTKGAGFDGLTTPNTGAGILLLLLGLAVAGLLCRYFDESTSVLQIPYLPEMSFPVIQKG